MTEKNPEYPLIGPDITPGEYRGALTIAVDKRGHALLQMRDDIEGIIAPGRWGFFGGGVEAGEDLQTAASREFLEETGLAFDRGEFLPFASVVSTLPHHGLLYVHVLKRPIPPQDIRLGEGSGFAFGSPGQVEKLDLIPYLKTVLDRYFATRP